MSETHYKAIFFSKLKAILKRFYNRGVAADCNLSLESRSDSWHSEKASFWDEEASLTRSKKE